MDRIVVDRPGGYERLRRESRPDPQPGPGEVLVDVHAAGVNLADGITRMGLYPAAVGHGYPIVPGLEAAGTVAAVGEGVDDITPGTRVMALTLFGGYATHLVVPRDQVATIPQGLSTDTAAGFPVVFLTAWYALFELAHPRPGASVLVHSAAGGVGGALVQLAGLAGARVVGVVGAPHKVAAVEALGAAAVIDRSRSDLWAEAERLAPEGFDIVLDANGPATLRGSHRHLARGGKLVVYGFHTMFTPGRGRPHWLRLVAGVLGTPRFSPMRLTRDNYSVMGFNLSLMTERRDLLRTGLDEITAWAGQGRLQPLPVTRYRLSRAADAHRAIESAQTVGKLVLVPDDRWQQSCDAVE